jgi:hypothetical protein
LNYTLITQLQLLYNDHCAGYILQQASHTAVINTTLYELESIVETAYEDDSSSDTSSSSAKHDSASSSSSVQINMSNSQLAHVQQGEVSDSVAAAAAKVDTSSTSDTTDAVDASDVNSKDCTTTTEVTNSTPAVYFIYYRC